MYILLDKKQKEGKEEWKKEEGREGKQTWCCLLPYFPTFHPTHI